jgi:cell division protease FtsH
VNKSLKTVVFWMVMVVAAMLLWNIVRSDRLENQIPEITYTQFMADVDAGKVESVSIKGTQIRGRYRDGNRTFRLTGPSDLKVFLGTLQEKGVQVTFRDASSPSGPLQLLGTWAPLFLLGALWFFMIRQMRRGRPGTPAPPGPNSPINPV